MKVIDGPLVVSPINAAGGLYMSVLRSESERLKDFYPELKRLAEANGFDPEGGTTVGMPTRYGLGTVTVAVWFHDRKKR